MDIEKQIENTKIETRSNEGAAVGILLGCAIGMLFVPDNIVGMVFGISIGMFIGLTIGSCIIKKENK